MKFTAFQEHKENELSLKKFIPFQDFERRTNLEDAGEEPLFSQLRLFKSHHNNPVQLKDNIKDQKHNNAIKNEDEKATTPEKLTKDEFPEKPET